MKVIMFKRDEVSRYDAETIVRHNPGECVLFILLNDDGTAQAMTHKYSYGVITTSKAIDIKLSNQEAYHINTLADLNLNLINESCAFFVNAILPHVDEDGQLVGDSGYTDEVRARLHVKIKQLTEDYLKKIIKEVGDEDESNRN